MTGPTENTTAGNTWRGEAPDNNAMHAKPDLRVVLKWMIARSGSVIADVMCLKTMDNLNYISVSETAEREISASGAKLAVRISGQSFFAGREAFKKAAEVSECVRGLSSCGIAADKIQIKNVSAQVESGFLAKSSSATYDLEVMCETMDLLGPAIATIVSLKNSNIVSIAWNYSELDRVKREILQEAVQLTNASATAIVAALGTSLAGIHRLKYEMSGLDDKLAAPLQVQSRMRKAKFADSDIANAAEGLSLSHTATVAVHVKADFLVKVE